MSLSRFVYGQSAGTKEVTSVPVGQRLVEPVRQVPLDVVRPPPTKEQMEFLRQFGRRKGFEHLVDIHHNIDTKPKAIFGRAVEKGGVYVWNKYLHKIPLGLYPKGYNFRVHGFYHPGRFYGKLDTAFGDVKLGDLKAWIGRRDKSVTSTIQMVGRAHARWIENNASQGARFAYGGQAFFQFCVMLGIYSWFIKKSTGLTGSYPMYYYHW